MNFYNNQKVKVINLSKRCCKSQEYGLLTLIKLFVNQTICVIYSLITYKLDQQRILEQCRNRTLLNQFQTIADSLIIDTNGYNYIISVEIAIFLKIIICSLMNQ
ncbi:unnamed protein product [Paramecium octaurelia]|uniref:Transmembrane protein n=1 Tax=Paramecium octaurelia TaxID=43137 RepID=A0A8S1U4A2_PAROT|nr:unnamed protein product [Paramecium octaurelia]